MNDGNMSLADIAAVTNGDGGAFGGGSGAWWIIVLFLFAAMGGGGVFGGGAAAANAVTADQMQRAIDLNSIQQGQAGISADVQRTAWETMGTVKDAAYNNLGELRDVQAGVSGGFASVQSTLAGIQGDIASCCCTTQRSIDAVNYNLASQSAAIQANSTANAQKILDAIQGNRMADMQNQINALQLQNAVSGVVRYPMASTYSAGANPFCGTQQAPGCCMA